MSKSRSEATRRAVRAAGGIQRVAKVFGISKQAVSMWIWKGKVPMSRLRALVQLAEGEVTATEMRPDLAKALEE